MRIYIMRHGEAELMARTDADRRLTEYGAMQSFEQGKQLKPVAETIDHVIVSPYARAQQTFEQLNRACEGRLKQPEIWAEIVPNGNGEAVRDYLEVLRQAGSQSVLLVSHLPIVGSIVAELCGRNSVDFYTSTLAEIDWDGTKGEVLNRYHYGK